ncbi:MAG: multicopper oxidase domain-containing protein [Candidatus Jettenia sp.]|nr:MAG: multicopper oxidase domain-containing protein [Candidatus Jettenia sp.]
MERRYKKIVWGMGAIALLNGLVFFTHTVVAHAVDIISNVAKDPTDIPVRISRFCPKTVTVNLIAKEVVADLAPGKKFWFWTFAQKKGDTVGPATVPGPMIRVMEGDTVVINLTNDLHNEEPHNLDFHAGFGAMLMDIEPGETDTLTFKAMRKGAYIYHCGAEGMPWEHVAYGMYGLIVVEPRGGLPKVDKEFYIGQGEWYLKQGIEDHPNIPGYSLNEKKALAEHPDYFTFNGHTQALMDPSIYGNAITVNQGDKVRLFFVAGGPNIGSNFHIIGQIFDKFYSGHHLDFIRNEETAYVPPGSAAVFEFKALATGDFSIVDHALFRVPKGAGGLLHVK